MTNLLSNSSFVCEYTSCNFREYSFPFFLDEKWNLTGIKNKRNNALVGKYFTYLKVEYIIKIQL